jgi:hypothetical protein
VAHHKQKKKESEMRRLREAVAKADQIPEPPEKEGAIERHLHREAHGDWKVVCSCTAVRYYHNMDIGQLNDTIQHSFHPQHTKAVFFRENMGSHQFRGRIPAMTEGD